MDIDGHMDSALGWALNAGLCFSWDIQEGHGYVFSLPSFWSGLTVGRLVSAFVVFHSFFRAFYLFLPSKSTPPKLQDGKKLFILKDQSADSFTLDRRH